MIIVAFRYNLCQGLRNFYGCERRSQLCNTDKNWLFICSSDVNRLNKVLLKSKIFICITWRPLEVGGQQRCGMDIWPMHPVIRCRLDSEREVQFLKLCGFKFSNLKLYFAMLLTAISNQNLIYYIIISSVAAYAVFILEKPFFIVVN